MRHTAGVATLAVVLSTSVLLFGSSAQARLACAGTRCDPPRTVELSGSSWLGGNGVDVYSNGASSSNDAGRSYVTNSAGQSVYAGEKWQCVELVNRLYLTRGWISSTWWGNGNQLYANAPSGLSKDPQGSISSISPGDVVSFDYSERLGHAAVVNSATRNSDGSTFVQLVNQNAIDLYSSATLRNGTLTMSGWAGYSVIGVIHAPTAAGGGVSEGAFLRASDTGRVYRVAGGAPLYVDSWTPFGGPQPTVATTQAAIDAMPAYPRDGTFISDLSNRRMYKIAGGAPEYVSAADANNVPGYGTQPIIGVSGWDLANYDHLRPYPVDGTFISNVADGRVYRVAGGAPEYVSAADATQVPGWGTQPITVIIAGVVSAVTLFVWHVG